MNTNINFYRTTLITSILFVLITFFSDFKFNNDYILIFIGFASIYNIQEQIVYYFTTKNYPIVVFSFSLASLILSINQL